MSGSTDGLLNLFDTKIQEEEDALYQTVNHGSSIHHAGFLTDVGIFALSHDEKFSIYEMITSPEENVEEPPPVHFGDLRERLRCEYVANILPRPSGSAVAGIGSHRYLMKLLCLRRAVANITTLQHRKLRTRTTKKRQSMGIRAWVERDIVRSSWYGDCALVLLSRQGTRV